MEVYLVKAEKLVNGEWTPHERPVENWLRWPVLRNLSPEALSCPMLPPGASRRCDFGSVTHSDHMPDDEVYRLPGVPLEQALFVLSTEPLYLHLGHLFAAGRYRFALEVSASNSTPRPFWFVLQHDGTWSDDERTMLNTLTFIHQVVEGRWQDLA